MVKSPQRWKANGCPINGHVAFDGLVMTDDLKRAMLYRMHTEGCRCVISEPIELEVGQGEVLSTPEG